MADDVLVLVRRSHLDHRFLMAHTCMYECLSLPNQECSYSKTIELSSLLLLKLLTFNRTPSM